MKTEGPTVGRCLGAIADPGAAEAARRLHVASLLADDPLRRRALEAVARLGLADCWIAAGFVRDAVWDDLHAFGTQAPAGDVDVVFHEPLQLTEEYERRLELELAVAMPDLRWSARNQARMHLRNGDAPYGSVAGAMRCWPETATAVAARIGALCEVEIAAPLGLADLFALRLRPTQAFSAAKRPVFLERVASKRWLARYPELRLLDGRRANSASACEGKVG